MLKFERREARQAKEHRSKSAMGATKRDKNKTKNRGKVAGSLAPSASLASAAGSTTTPAGTTSANAAGGSLTTDGHGMAPSASLLPPPHSDAATEARLMSEARHNYYLKTLLLIEIATIRADAEQQAAGGATGTGTSIAKMTAKQRALLHGTTGAVSPGPSAPPAPDSDVAVDVAKLLGEALTCLEQVSTPCSYL